MSDHDGDRRGLRHNGRDWVVSDAFRERIYRTDALRGINYEGPLDDDGYPPLGLGFCSWPPYGVDGVDYFKLVGAREGAWSGGWNGVNGSEDRYGLTSELDRLVERKGWQS
jgi:hypothetical protein